ncbi:hypothetical protein SESBI_16731 [Sesbania bispinosa]|nr:hypothetical protein SESBI_16731 [Sesbania bispinosa]
MVNQNFRYIGLRTIIATGRKITYFPYQSCLKKKLLRRSIKDRLGDAGPIQGRPEKRARIEEIKDTNDSRKGVGSSISLSSPQQSSGVPPSPRISWATPDPEEDAALKLLSQQGQRVFKGTSASEMKDFLGQVGTWCLRGAMMAEFFHSTIDEVAALPQIKKDFEAITQKLKDDEVKMADALGKVKGLSEDNLKLTEKNGKLLEEIE